MRLCSGPGCGRAIADDQRFCDDCRPKPTADTSEIRTHTSGYDAELDRLRKSKRWQTLRYRVVLEQPLCSRCDALTEEVDHVVPAREAIEQARASGLYPLDRYAGYYFRSNLRGLCRLCHRAKTLEEKTHTGTWPDVVAREQAAPKRRYAF